MWAEIRVKRAQWPNAALAYLPTDLSTRARHQTLASLQAFPADRRYSTYMKPMRQADGLHTFVDAAMHAGVDS